MSDEVDLPETTDPIALTCEIVAAYVSNNALNPADLARLIADVHASLSALGSDPVTPPRAEELKPAVPIKRSVTPEYIICLEDGKKFKSLKRHLSTHYGLTPEQYREKWGLPKDYPMVAPNYSAARSQLAKNSGLGRKPAPAPQPRGRRAKVNAGFRSFPSAIDQLPFEAN